MIPTTSHSGSSGVIRVSTTVPPNSTNRPTSAAISACHPKASSASHISPSNRGAVDAITVSPIRSTRLPATRSPSGGSIASGGGAVVLVVGPAVVLGGVGASVASAESVGGSGKAPNSTVSGTSITTAAVSG